MEWISIKEYQPHHGQICRIKTVHGIEAIAPYNQHEDESGGQFSYRELDKVTIWLDVTHWMPLPEDKNEMGRI